MGATGSRTRSHSITAWLVCYDNGSIGGSGYTVEKAARKGHRFINLYNCAER